MKYAYDRKVVQVSAYQKLSNTTQYHLSLCEKKGCSLFSCTIR